MSRHSPKLKENLDLVAKLEGLLKDPSLPKNKLFETLELYEEVLRICARDDFASYNKYLELDEDANDPNKKFYHHRKEHMGEIFQALNDMEIHDKYDILIVNTPPRWGKTTTGLRYLSWIGGRYPLYTQMATSYSDNITTSFYNGTMEVVQSDRFKAVFPDSPLVAQNAKRQEIFLKEQKRYPALMYVPIDGSMTGRAESSKILYTDDLVSGVEMALSPTRLDSLWEKFTVNAYQRRKDGCKIVMICTPWSVHDPSYRLATMHEGNPRFKHIKIPCYRENGESAGDWFGGFSTKYYKEIEEIMDSASFSALYLQEPIEREGLLYHEGELQTYLSLPEGKPDAIIGVVDTKGTGKDYLSAPIAYVYGEEVYIEDVVFTNELPEITIPKVSQAMVDHKVQRLYIEAQSGGEYFGLMVDDEIRKRGGNTSIRTFFTTKNKEVKIVMQSDFVKKKFIFKDKSLYAKNSPYGEFMRQLLSYSQTAKKNKHDDAPDSVAMLAEFIQTIVGNRVQVMDRRDLRI